MKDKIQKIYNLIMGAEDLGIKDAKLELTLVDMVELVDLIDKKSYQYGYNDGYDEGYNDGYDDGLTQTEE